MPEVQLAMHTGPRQSHTASQSRVPQGTPVMGHRPRGRLRSRRALVSALVVGACVAGCGTTPREVVPSPAPQASPVAPAEAAAAPPAQPGLPSRPPSQSAAPEPQAHAVQVSRAMPEPPATSAPPTAPSASHCVFPPTPAAEATAPVSPPPASPACRNHRSDRAAVARIVRRRFQRAVDRSVADVGFDCDGLGPTIDEIVVERGFGRSVSLQLLRLWRTAAEPGVFHVRGLYYMPTLRSSDDYTYRVAEAFAVRRVETTIRASRIEPLLPRMRTALTARIRRVEPPSATSGVFGGTRNGASSDLHALLRLRDAEGRTLERRYTGEEDADQRGYLGLQLAMDGLDAILDALKPAPTPLTAEDRAFFANRWAAALPHFDDEDFWWVRQRFVAMAGRAGTPALVPGLLDLLQHVAPPPHPHVRGDGSLDLSGSGDRTRVEIVNDLTALTGYDARYDASAHPRTITDVAADYLQACHPQAP